jgi:hypothetical protein
VTTSLALNPIEVVGKDFINTVTKDRFQVIGVEYVSLFAADLTYQQKLTTCFLSLAVTNPMDLQASMEPGIHLAIAQPVCVMPLLCNALVYVELIYTVCLYHSQLITIIHR